MAAKKCVEPLDNQLRWVTGQGLDRFKHNPELPWDKWPHLSVGMDLGSDGNTGYHALDRLLCLNVDMFNDGSHGCSRDVTLVLKALGLWGLLCVSW